MESATTQGPDLTRDERGGNVVARQRPCSIHGEEASRQQPRFLSCDLPLACFRKGLKLGRTAPQLMVSVTTPVTARFSVSQSVWVVVSSEAK